jgi:hypothetical protein
MESIVEQAAMNREEKGVMGMGGGESMGASTFMPSPVRAFPPCHFVDLFHILTLDV